MLNLPDFASALQDRGITTLLYDPRSTGYSGGQPRNDIDPPQAMGDMSDALSFLAGLPSVDPNQVGLFGISFGGAVALTTAAVDPRVRLVIAVAPPTDVEFESPEKRQRVLQKCMEDRVSQTLGNPPFYVPVINQHGDNAVGFGHGIDRGKWAQLLRNGREIAPGHVNRVTLMSYYKLSMWQPWPLWKLLGSDQGVLFVIPGHDQMSYPELQRKMYKELGGGFGCRKRKLEIESSGHEDILSQDHIDIVVDSTTGFIQDILQGVL